MEQGQPNSELPASPTGMNSWPAAVAAAAAQLAANVAQRTGLAPCVVGVVGLGDPARYPALGEETQHGGQ